jgi:hypothetical protein
MAIRLQEPQAHARYLAFRSIRPFIHQPAVRLAATTTNTAAAAYGSSELEAVASVAVAARHETSYVAKAALPCDLPSSFERCNHAPGNSVNTGWLHGQPVSESTGLNYLKAGTKQWQEDEHVLLEEGSLNLLRPAVLAGDDEAIPPAAVSTQSRPDTSPTDERRMSAGDVAQQVYLMSTLRGGGALSQRASNIYRAVHLSSSSAVLFTRYTVNTVLFAASSEFQCQES